MNNRNYTHENVVSLAGGFFAGFLIGGLAAAGTVLLLAPQSGKRTRAKIQQKSIELREQTTKAVEDTLKQAGVKARQIKSGVREGAKELEQRSQEVLAEQKEHWSTLVQAGKTAVQGVRA